MILLICNQKSISLSNNNGDKTTNLIGRDLMTPEEVIDEIKKQCAENNVEFELISKLIVEIEANKNYTKGSRVTKAFDRIINQGWLHFETIQRGLNHEDQ